MVEEARKWMYMARQDYGVSQHLFNTYYPKPLEIICYHCQQAAEKSIKAVILAQGAPGGMPKSHDLSFLLNQIKNYVVIDEKYYDYADILNPYGVVVRYPSELNLVERNAEKAIEYAGEIIAWAEMHVKSLI
ncbi:MAG: HEPN domain-containing protein [Clostridiales bacterium]|nr:HEPN domain-containing protein [Clostridiales bacterium]